MSMGRLVRHLFDRKIECLALAEKAHAEDKTGTEIHYRTIAAESDYLAAWLDGDDSAQIMADKDKLALKRAVERIDADMLDYRVSIQVAS